MSPWFLSKTVPFRAIGPRNFAVAPVSDQLMSDDESFGRQVPWNGQSHLSAGMGTGPLPSFSEVPYTAQRPSCVWREVASSSL